jgi:SAM-dependent methyltransferase
VVRPSQNADIIVSIDAFEHFDDPEFILREMDSMLAPDGEVWISFGPTWYHPSGGHLFSVFPWAHLLFSEKALIRWRSDFKHDGATRFSEVGGGLNQMTIARFERIVEASPFQIASLQIVPIQKLKFLHNRLTREFTTAVVRCHLVKTRGTGGSESQAGIK